MQHTTVRIEFLADRAPDHLDNTDSTQGTGIKREAPTCLFQLLSLSKIYRAQSKYPISTESNQSSESPQVDGRY